MLGFVLVPFTLFSFLFLYQISLNAKMWGGVQFLLFLFKGDSIVRTWG